MSDAAAVGAEVWILDLSISGPQPGDWWGWRSTHATKQGAEATLLDRLHDQQVDMSEDVDQIANTTQDDGSIAADFVVYGDQVRKVGYGVQRDVVAP
ncbi:hypothetical protein SEA_HAMMY_37 [Mycobacterium phage Hammy]|uniref:Uncharacterized protein n=2 Tax=Amginevirus TaxID=2946794 RepID=A0A222ZNP1_9CAUD|nr:hypothetical protein I5G85_gp62 [Mycobacterium phage Amohnition]YP_009951995.1 hypothetical protein I5G86_gp62 [Mycobacterium phage DarthP]APD18203.1 hypothetical protein SEA_HAMMY_37 [Mycobacterium phage Hammy]ASR86317.1 hypothetical protein SEA_AMOHNITION_37 [Mycobacterium phage Amohnition]ASW31783.1 hypothetical protein SEA_DARTHP_37 [Mycobacterium phage DarthP]